LRIFQKKNPALHKSIIRLKGKGDIVSRERKKDQYLVIQERGQTKDKKKKIMKGRYDRKVQKKRQNGKQHSWGGLAIGKKQGGKPCWAGAKEGREKGAVILPSSMRGGF